MFKFIAAAVLFFSSFPTNAEETVKTLDIVGSIDSNSVDTVLEKLKEIMVTNPKTITVILDTPGGSIVAGLKIIDAIRNTNVPTTCVVKNFAVSMGAIILESSACGKRVVYPYSVVMFHGGANDAGPSNQREKENNVAAITAMNRITAELVASRIGLSVETYLRLIINESKELWFVGSDAVKAGIADEVLPLPSPAK